MAHVDIPVTPAVRLLRERGIPFDPLLYDYEDRGGAPRAAAELGVPLHAVVKTLVMETEAKTPLLVLMHGDLEVSTKNLARALGVKRVGPCDAATAQKHTGYLVGGISPIGTRARMTVYAERSVLEMDRIYLNGGKRGFLVALSPADLARIIPVTPVSVAVPLG